MNFLILFFASGFGAGYVPLMPGTAGSLIGILVFLLIHRMVIPLYIITVVAFVFLSIWASGRAEIIYGKRDDKRIVIDEIVGMLVGLFAMPVNIKIMLAGFLLFRFFDIAKVFPANLVQSKLDGGPAVVLDDIVAGIYTFICLHIVRAFL